MIDKEKMTGVELEKVLEKYELQRIHTDLFEKIVLLVIASLGLITALAWDTALTHLFRELFGGNETLAEEVTYALIITVIAAVVSVLLSRSLRNKQKPKP